MNQDQEHMSRRKLLVAFGAAGVALASQSLLAGSLNGSASAQSSGVSEHVYGKDGKGNNPKPSVRIDWYNVTDYGAAGDGVADDFAALNQLIGGLGNNANAMTLYFPQGTYRIGTNLTFPRTVRLLFDQGAMLAPASGVALTVDASIEAGMTQIFAGEGSMAGSFGASDLYPQWWGAKGDGSADDTTALQRVLNLSKTNGGVTIVVPKGVYKVTRTLLIYRSTRLSLNHNTVLKRHHNDSFFLNGDYGAQYDRYEGHGNIVMEGGTLDGNIIQYPDAFNGINIGHASNVTIRDMTIKDISWAHAIEIDASSGVLVQNCKFLGYKNAADGSRYFSEAIQIDAMTKLGFTAFGKYDGTPSRNITVRDCYFGASGTVGTTAWPAGVGTHGAIHDAWAHDIRIVNNTFDRLTYWAVRLFKWNDCLVQGNTMLGCGGGVTVSTPAPNSESTKDKDGIQRGTPQAGSRMNISDNVITGTTQFAAISCYGADQVYAQEIAITNNIVRDVAESKTAITTSWCRHVQMEGNIVSNVRRGIYTENTLDCRVAGNRIENALADGIWLSKGSNLAVHGNTMKRCGSYGILLNEITAVTVDHNIADSVGAGEANRYDGIMLSSKVENGSIHSNTVRKAVNGNPNRYGIQITASCKNIDTFNNIVEGASGHYRNSSTTSSDSYCLYSPNGSCYKVTVDDAGVLTTRKIQ